MNELISIQQKLKAPKGQYNSFGKYKYRSCEDILEAVKPLVALFGCTLTISDDLVYLGNRYYIKATATITNAEGKTETVTAFAREPEEKKGMDGSQITGTASSYARKYALNGLFLIDDTKDADTDEYKRQQDAQEAPPAMITEAQVQSIRIMLQQVGKSEAGMLEYVHKKSLSDMNVNEYVQIMNMLEKCKKKGETA